MALTVKQEAFAVRVGTEGLTQAEAYKLTYDCSKSNPDTIRTRAYELASSPVVAERIGVLRGAVQAEAQRKASYTLKDAIAEAEEIRAEAFSKGNMTAANAAAALKAKLAGHMVERKEVRFGALEQSDVEELEAMQAELRKRLAERRGIETAPDDGNRPQLRPS